MKEHIKQVRVLELEEEELVSGLQKSRYHDIELLMR